MNFMKMTPRDMMVYGGAAVVGLMLLFNSLFIVRETEQVMVVALGRIERLVTTPGLHFKVPFYQQLVYFDKRILYMHSQPEEVLTDDKKRVVMDSFTRWVISDAAQFYRSVRSQEGAASRLSTIVNSNIRQVVGKVPLHELIGEKRSEVMLNVLRASRKEAEGLGLRIVDVRIKRADLPPENSEAVFRRMRAERQKEAAEIRAGGEESAQKIRADAEKQRTILLAEAQRDGQKLRGDGDASAMRIGGAAFNQDPEFYKLTRSLEAYRAGLTSNTIFVLDGGTEYLDTLLGK